MGVGVAAGVSSVVLRLGRRFGLFTQALVDRADLLYPPAAIAVLQVEDVPQGPVKVIGDEGYLLVELIERVAYDPPASPEAPTSTSNFVSQLGHVTAARVWPVSLMRR